MKKAISPATAVIIILVVVIVVVVLGYAMFLRKGPKPSADEADNIVPDQPEQGMAMPGEAGQLEAAADQPMEMEGGNY